TRSLGSSRPRVIEGNASTDLASAMAHSASSLARPLAWALRSGSDGGVDPKCRHGPAPGMSMEAFLISASSLLLAEMGDKTQLMALVLAARFRRPVTVMLAILVATIALNGMAVAVGAVVGDFLRPDILRWALGLSFLGAAAWAFFAADEAEPEPGVRS